MKATGVKLALAAIVSGLIVVFSVMPWPVLAQSPGSILEEKGVTKYKGRYLLKAEGDVYQSLQETRQACAVADAAIAEAGAIQSRNQAIVEYQQRIAGDAALAGQMREEFRDGKTLAEQFTRRAAKKDEFIAKQQRAGDGLALQKVTPKKALAAVAKAEAACQFAIAQKQALVQTVRDVAERYKEVGSDPDVREAIGKARFGPSDGFKKLAANMKIVIPKPSKSDEVDAPPAAKPKRLTEALEELVKAEDQLKSIEFRQGKEYEKRVTRRDQTVKVIREAIDKLERGDADVLLVEKAVKLNGGYEGPNWLPIVRKSISEAGDKLRHAATLMRSPGGE